MELSEWVRRKPRLTAFITIASLAGGAVGGSVGYREPVLSTANARVLIVSATGRDVNSFEVQPLISELVLTMDLPSTFEQVARDTDLSVAELRKSTQIIRDPADPFVQIEIKAGNAEGAQFAATRFATVSLKAMADNALKRASGSQTRIRASLDDAQAKLVQISTNAGVSDITTFVAALNIESQTLTIEEANATSDAERADVRSRLATINRKIIELSGVRAEVSILNQEIQSMLPLLANASASQATAAQQVALANEGAGVVLYSVTQGSRLSKAVQLAVAGLFLVASCLFGAAVLVIAPFERRKNKP